jgi:hypothetical protein
MKKQSKSVLVVATRHDLSVIVEFVGFACHSLFRELIRGSQNREQKMNEASIVIMCLIAGALWAVMSYSVGFKEGQRQGYTRGRAVARHAVSADRKVK